MEEVQVVQDAPRERGRERLPRAGAETTSITLSNGAVMLARPVKGIDLERAAMSAQGRGDFAVQMAVVAQVCTIDGEAIIYEDLYEMPGEDVGLLINHVLGKEPGPAPETSSD